MPCATLHRCPCPAPGYCLPEKLEPPYFEWLYWPQALLPFEPEELEFIARLDPEGDIQLLRRELPGIREEVRRLLYFIVFFVLFFDFSN